MKSESSDQVNKAKIKAARYCAGAERSPHQVLEKLLKYGLSEDEAQQTLGQLQTENFTNEHRFAKAFIHDKFLFNKWGKLRISIELIKHNISLSVIEKGLNTLDNNEYRLMIDELLSKKWDQLTLTEHFLIKKRKTCQFVISKGFEGDLVINQFHKNYPSKR